MDEASITSSAIVDRLGGNKALADALGLDANTISGWRARGLPAWSHADLLDIARIRGVTLTLDELRAVTSGKRHLRGRGVPA